MTGSPLDYVHQSGMLDTPPDASGGTPSGARSYGSTTYTGPVMTGTGGAPESSTNPYRLHYQDEFEFAQEYGQQLGDFKRQIEKADQFGSNASNLDVWAAAFVNFNPISAWVAHQPLPDVPAVAGYSPYDDKGDGATDIHGYEQWWQSFMDSQNPETTAAIKSRIDTEINNQKIIQGGGATGVLASVAAGIADPFNLAMLAIPLTTEATAGKIAAQAAGYGLVASGSTELVLHAAQETRTIEDSFHYMAAGALIDGTLGAVIGKLAAGQRAQLNQQVVNHIRNLSAGQVVTAPEVVSGPLSYLARQMSKATPLGRTIQSKLDSVRAAVGQLTESAIKMEGDYVPTAVESLVKLDYAKMSEAANRVRQLERDYMKATGQDHRSFNVELTGAMRRGDDHPNPIVKQAASILRSHIDDLWERAAAARIPGTFVEEIAADGTKTIKPYRTTTADSYMARRYDLNVIRANPEGFKRSWMEGLRDMRERENLAAAAKGEPLKPVSSDDELYEIATEIYERVTGMHVGDLHFNAAPSGATALKTRVDVKDSFLEDYLVKDWNALIEGYTKSVAPRVRMAEKFGEGEGGYTMKEQLDAIRNEYSVQIAALDRQVSAASSARDRKGLQLQRDELVKKMNADVRDIEIMRDRILNVSQEMSWMNPENRGVLSALRAARSWNIVTMLSNVVLSSIPDMARVITYHGGSKFIKAFTKSAFTRDIRRTVLPKDDMARVASALERTSTYRLSQISEVDDGIVYTRLDKYAHWMASKTLGLSGMKHWNSMFKTVAGYLTSDKMGRMLMGGVNTPELRALGIGDDIFDDVADQVKRHGFDDDGLFNLNLEQWTDRKLVEAIEAAAIKEADRLVITPGVGDKPILFTSEIGRTIFQFKSFMMAATNRMMLPMFQEKGVRPWIEIMTQLGLGAGVYYMREQMAGREPSEDPSVVITRAIGNTGLAGYAMELMRASQAVTGFNPAAGESDSKFHARGPWGTLLGPSAETANNVWKFFNGNTSPEQRAKAFRKLLPMQNHFLLRHGYDMIEAEAARAMGTSL